jgi:hypothetical protein
MMGNVVSLSYAAWLLARARGARSAVDHHTIFKIAW